MPLPITTPATMTAAASTFPLTLILAATPSLGIGKAGTLPWPQLRKEMGYFARVTKRVAPTASCARNGAGGGRGDGAVNDGAGAVGRRLINAVVMGRKTWDSIPPRFRPLPGRLNVIVSRDAARVARSEGKEGVEGPLVVGSLKEAVDRLSSYGESSTDGSPAPLAPAGASPSTSTLVPSTHVSISRIFVIGGATLYAAALELPQADRVLLTKIHTEYSCDTFFPIHLEHHGSGWRQCTVAEVQDWTGEEDVVGRVVEEQGVEFEFEMFVREK